MSDAMPPLPELSAAQQEIMEIVWEQGEVTALEVSRIISQTREVARNTVRTLLERMESKGWLTHRAEGRTFYYSPACPRQESIGQKVQQVVEHLCGGSPETLVLALLDYRGLNSDELQRIRRLLDEAQARRAKKGGKP